VALDEAADATVGLGRRVLNRLLRRTESQHAIESAVVDVAGNPDDLDAAAVLRWQIRKALVADQHLAAEIAGMLSATRTEATGSRSVATHATPASSAPATAPLTSEPSTTTDRARSLVVTITGAELAGQRRGPCDYGVLS
jgi:hypothetical protein